MSGDGAPAYWVRQRAGDTDTVRLSAAEAAMVAQRPGAVGDYLSPAGLVWRERNADVRGGWDHFTITPVWESLQ
ncbi:hypothetical protein GCM10009839_38810 [Catenulispora yoronensis]|uniref:Uncharacterized protein n=1 Tax=Catenulispora yoronensis TaxID=450799 RepID=A0ABN2UCA2_9ACTN